MGQDDLNRLKIPFLWIHQNNFIMLPVYALSPNNTISRCGFYNN